MSLKDYHFYHPFKNSTFGFLSESQTYLANNVTGNLIEHIDMYYQPLENPFIAVSFSSLKLIFILIGELINIKLLMVIRKEAKSILTDVTKLFVICQMIYHPILECILVTTNLIHPVDEIFGEWFCTLAWFSVNFFVRVALYNSFIVAVMRYIFIIHEARVAAYGKENIKRLFLYLTIGIPLLHMALKLPESSSMFSFIKKCYGEDHKVFLAKTSTLNVLNSNFWKLKSYSIYQFDDLFIDIGKKICKIVDTLLLLIMGFNITEGALYCRIFLHLNR